MPSDMILMRKNNNQINGSGGEKVDGNSLETQLRHLGSSDHVQELMENLGWAQKLSPTVLTAALDLAGRSLDQNLLLNQARQFFRKYAVFVPDGIATVPAAWLKELPSLLLSTLKAHWKFVPYMITELRFQNGVLCISFAQETPRVDNRFTPWDQIRVTINRTLRPNLWKELTHQEKYELCESYPELGSELLQLPSSAGDASARVSDDECADANHDND